MITNSLDILYISLAISAILLTIFLCVNLIYSMQVLRDLSKASEKIRDASEKIHDYVLAPVKSFSSFLEYFMMIVSAIIEKFNKKDK